MAKFERFNIGTEFRMCQCWCANGDCDTNFDVTNSQQLCSPAVKQWQRKEPCDVKDRITFAFQGSIEPGSRHAWCLVWHGFDPQSLVYTAGDMCCLYHSLNIWRHTLRLALVKPTPTITFDLVSFHMACTVLEIRSLTRRTCVYMYI